MRSITGAARHFAMTPAYRRASWRLRYLLELTMIRAFFDRFTRLFDTLHLPLDDAYGHTHVPRGESTDESVF